jgi:hypothetical protein
MKHTVKTPYDIPGWTNPPQHNLYKKLVEQLPKNPKVLEIGCAWGRSAWAWLDVLPNDAEFYVLDNFSLSSNRHLPEFYDTWNNYELRKFASACLKRNWLQKEIFLYCIQQHPSFSNIKNIYDNDYFDWKIDNDIKFDLVYIDGDHSYKHVNDQLEYFKDVPIVCGDDYKEQRRDYFEGLMTAVDNYIENNNVKYELFPTNKNGLFIIYNK